MTNFDPTTTIRHTMIDFDPTTIPLGHTYDDAGRVLTYRDSDGACYKYTHNSDGSWYKYGYADAGRVVKWYSKEMDSNSTGDEAPDANLLALRIVLIICLVASIAHSVYVTFA